MNVATARFGVIDVSSTNVFKVTTPLLGFPDTESLIFLQKENMMPFKWLQSVQEPDLTLVVVEPFHFFHDYKPRIIGSDLKEVGAESIEEVCLYAIVVLPNDMSKMTANLRRPLLVNKAQRKMKQARRSDDRYSFQESVLEGIKHKTETEAGTWNQYEIHLN